MPRGVEVHGVVVKVHSRGGVKVHTRGGIKVHGRGVIDGLLEGHL